MVVRGTTSGVNEALAYDARGLVTARQFNDSGVTPAETYTYDADGQITTASISSISGVETYAYNADGTLSKKVEPTGIGGNSFQYSYYNNGLQSGINVTGALLGSGLQRQYSYDSAGRLVTKSFAYGGNTVTLNSTWSKAGRPNSLQFSSGNLSEIG